MKRERAKENKERAKEGKPPLSDISTLTNYTGTTNPRLLCEKNDRMKELRCLLDVIAKNDAIRQVSEAGAQQKDKPKSSEHTEKTEQGIKQRYEDDAEIVEQALPALLETLGISSVVTELYIGKNVTLFLPAAKLFIALFDMGALCKELNG